MTCGIEVALDLAEGVLVSVLPADLGLTGTTGILVILSDCVLPFVLTSSLTPAKLATCSEKQKGNIDQNISKKIKSF